MSNSKVFSFVHKRKEEKMIFLWKRIPPQIICRQIEAVEEVGRLEERRISGGEHLHQRVPGLVPGLEPAQIGRAHV